jgi:hypothetical protein
MSRTNAPVGNRARVAVVSHGPSELSSLNLGLTGSVSRVSMPFVPAHSSGQTRHSSRYMYMNILAHAQTSANERTKQKQLLLSLVFVALLTPEVGAQLHPNLTYQNRGRYSEGIRTAPSTGPRLDLISAMVDYNEPYSTLPQTFRALVYVPPQAEQAYLTIREIEPRYYYWLDKVQPETGWPKGTAVQFGWPTDKVIRALTWSDGPLRLEDLGAAARLGSPTPKSIEKILPVALYYSQPPKSADSYRFVFRPGTRMRLRFELYGESESEPLQTQVFRSVLAMEPHTTKWSTSGWQEGWYRLFVSGYELSNNAEIDAEVQFYHSLRFGR